jgi:Holliday junction resolvase RusA-like endonuclease
VQKNPVLIDKGIPVILEVEFYMPRPKGHYNTKGDIKQGKIVAFHTVKPDLDNLLKAVKDALKSICYHDDSQVIKTIAAKQYGGQPRIEITVKAGL